MSQVQLTLEVEEINLVLEGLGTQPYAKVYQLIQKIHQQAQSQLNPSDTSTQTNTEHKLG